jgi:tetratricopeptide (TPR) repeat protein
MSVPPSMGVDGALVGAQAGAMAPHETDARGEELSRLETQLARTPRDASLHLRRVELLSSLGRHAEAVAAAEALLALAPKAPEAWSELGAAYLAWGRHEAAELALRTAASLAPGDPEHAYNLALAWLALWRLDDAAQLLDQVVKAAPAHHRAWANLAFACGWLGLFDDEAFALDRALALAPDEPHYRWSRSLSLLRAGRWREGWEAYEARYRIHPTPAVARTWSGELLPGKTLLVAAEQGFGDTFQFVRHLAAARARVGRLVLACHPPLVYYLKSLSVADEVVPFGTPCEAAATVRLLSLPLVLETPEPAGASVPYLRADARRVAEWRARLAPDGRFIVALGWQGSRAYAADRHRSFPLASMRPLLEAPGLRFVSVQKDADAAELRAFPSVERLEGLDADGAFVDTAAVLACADAVVSSDTALVHLAGGMGRPAWAALGEVADWRWGRTGRSSPWYPTMRLVRREPGGDWADVFARIRDDLAVLRG